MSRTEGSADQLETSATDAGVAAVVETLFAPGGFARESVLPVIALDATGIILRVNEAFAAISLESVETLEGRRVYEFITDDEREEIQPLIESAFRERKGFAYTLRARRDRGDDVFLEWEATPLFDGEAMVALFLLAHDATDARKTELEYKHLYQIAQGINSAASLDDILLMTRNAVKEVSGFDRAGVWLARGDYLLGAWGTHLDGSLADERDRRLVFAEFSPEVYAEVASGRFCGKVAITDWVMQDSSIVTAETPLDFAYMALRVQGELAGVVFADNYPSRRALALEEIERLQPLCEQCAAAIRTARLVAERDHFVESRRNLNQTYAEVTQAPTFDETLRRVRAAIVRAGLFDRAGVYSVHGGRSHSAWGTDMQGCEKDEHGSSFLPESLQSMMAYLRQSGGNYCIWEASAEEDAPSTATPPYLHGLVALEVGDEVLGLIFVDNFISNRLLTAPAMEALAEFAKQVSVAVKNARLLEEQRKRALQQESLSRIAAILSASDDLSDVEKMTTDALVSSGGFDRASCWTWNPNSLCMEERSNSNRHDVVVRGKSAIIPMSQMHTEGELKLLRGEADVIHISSYVERYKPLASEDFDPVSALDMEGVGEHCMVALRVEGDFAGYIAVDNKYSQQPISEEDVAVLQAFARQVAAVMHQQRHNDRYRERQARLSRIAALLSANQEGVNIEQMTTDALVEVGGFDRASCWAWNPRSLCMERRSSSDATGVVIPDKTTRVPLSQLHPDGWLKLVKGEAEVIHTERLEEKYRNNYYTQYDVIDAFNMQGATEHCLVALKVEGEFVGSIAVDNKYLKRPITADDISRLQSFAQYAAIAIQQSRLRARLAEQRAQQELFSEVSQGLDANLPFNELLGRIHRGILAIEQVDRAGIWVFDPIPEWGDCGWGTGRDGASHPFRLEDVADIEQVYESIPKTGLAYYYWPDYSQAFQCAPDSPMYGVKEQASMPLYDGDSIIGLIAVDNLISGNALTVSQVEGLLPYARQARIVILERRRQRERLREAERSRWLSEITTAAIKGTPVDEIMAIAYEAMKSYGGFDRVGVFIVENRFPRVRGVWGTDWDGTCKEISHIRFSLSMGWKEAPLEYWNDHVYYIYEDYAKAFETPPGDVMYGVQNHALVLMKAHGQIVGSFDMDNPFRNAPISNSDVEAILPIAEQAAIAVYNALLQEERERNEAIKLRMEELAGKISSRAEISELLLFVRDVAIRQGGLDRAGVFLVKHNEKLVQAVWGTSREGEVVRAENVCFTFDEVINSPSGALFLDSTEYMLTRNYTQEMGLSEDDPMYGVRHHVAIPLRADNRLVGFLTGDNLLYQAPIIEENIRLLLPFTLQAAIAIRNIELKEERITAQRRQERLAQIAANIAANTDLSHILGMTRDAAVDAAGYDRAAVFLYDATRRELRGVWGTDVAGNREDISSRILDVNHIYQYGYDGIVFGDAEYHLVEDYSKTYNPPPDAPMHGAQHHVRIPLRIEGRVVGVLNADNFVTRRPITALDVQPLLPFANEAAIAIRNAQLLEERERDIRIQQRLAALATAINASHDLKDILRIFRDALVEVAGFERAGIWLYNERLQTWQGVWGTGMDGSIEDASAFALTQAEVEEMGLLGVATGAEAYVIAPIAPSAGEASPYAGVALHLGDSPMGFVTLDNRRSRSPISEESILRILPFADQAAVAIQNVRLLDDQWRYLARQRRLGILVASVSANHSLNEALRLARDAVVEGGEFDRAAIFLADSQNDMFYGVWGTDREGREIDITGESFEISTNAPMLQYMNYTGMGRYFLVPDYSKVYDVDTNDTMYGVKAHGGVPIEIDNELAGCIFVDNLTTQRPITQEDMLGILPFAHQVAAAIRNVSLLEERDRYLNRQRRLAALASAINANVELNEILRLARDAVTSGAGFDRAGIFLLDPVSKTALGVWGTDETGNECEISEIEFSYTDFTESFSIRRELEYGSYYLEPDWQSRFSLPPEDPMYGVHWHGLIPIVLDGKAVALLFVDNKISDRAISEEDMLGLLSLANHIGVAIRNAELFDNLKRAQAALVRSERLGAVGELAGGVAHNVNNILAAVMGYAELIQMASDASVSVRNYAQVIEKAAKDGADIVRRVQQFARKDKDDAPEVFDLSEIAGGAIELMRPLWQSASRRSSNPILVSGSLHPDVMVRGVASEIREVIVNLIRNAMDALPNGGAITLHCRASEGKALLSVSDNGMGMSEEVRIRLFEPFFTTKQAGLGLGLGLSLTWGIIERHGGTIDVRSEPGAGAEFVIALPLEQAFEPSQERRELDVDLSNVRIVLADDEEMVLSSMEALLSRRGAVVEAFPDAKSALDRLIQKSDDVDVIVSDQGMPGMTGLEFLAEAKRLFPSIRRVLLSGWGGYLAETMDVSAAERIVAKPVQGAELAALIAEMESEPCP